MASAVNRASIHRSLQYSGEVVSGTQRYKFFKRPMLPKVGALPPQVLLAPAQSSNNDPMLPIPIVPENGRREAEIQTVYRESEAQTLPYSPDISVAPGQHPELLLLKNISYESGYPLTEKEISMIEFARAKQEVESNLPPFTDEASLNLRKTLMEKQELREYALREAEIDAARQEKMVKLQQALAEREESNDFMTAQRLESVRLIACEAREKALTKLRMQRIKTLRRLAHQRQAADPVLLSDTKHSVDLVSQYFDRSSAVYAPMKRGGVKGGIQSSAAGVPLEGPSFYDVNRRIAPMENLQNLATLEASIPHSQRVTDSKRSSTFLQALRENRVVGENAAQFRPGHGTQVKAAEFRLTSSALRNLRITKRDVEEMHHILQRRKDQQGQQTSMNAGGRASPARPNLSPSGTQRSRGGTILNALLAKKPKGRPSTPDITTDREFVVASGSTSDSTAEERGQLLRRGDLDFQLAVQLLQRLLRGRAVQNIMFEGKFRRRELIAELKVAEATEAEESAAEAAELAAAKAKSLPLEELEMRRAQLNEVKELETRKRVEAWRNSTIAAVTGSVTSSLLQTLSQEKTRMETLEALQRIADAALLERRTLEAKEAGRRQRQDS